MRQYSIRTSASVKQENSSPAKSSSRTREAKPSRRGSATVSPARCKAEPRWRTGTVAQGVGGQLGAVVAAHVFGSVAGLGVETIEHSDGVV
jgi:hypothetical protein